MLFVEPIKPVTERWLLAALLIALSLMFWLWERSIHSLGFSLHYLLTAFVIARYLNLLLRDNTAATLTSFYQLYYGVGMLVSSAIISSEAEMIEIGATGTANGTFWLMLIFFVIGMEATVLGYRRGLRLRLSVPALRLPVGFDMAIMLLFIVPVLAIALYVILLTGGPVLRGIDRVTFWRYIAPTGTSILPTLVSQSFFFVAFIHLWRVRTKHSLTMTRLILVGYFLIGFFVLGQKFSLFILFINAWLIVKIGVTPSFRLKLSHLVSAIIMLAVLLLSVAISYMIDGQGLDFILVRAALQAQLLWSVSESMFQGIAPSLRPECYFGCDWYASGMDYISYMYLPVGTYDFYKNGGTVLSGFMPALPIFTLGPVFAAILHIIVGFFMGILQRKTTTALSKKQPIYGFLLFKFQLSMSAIWFASMQTAIPGLIPVLGAIIIYRLVSTLKAPRNINYAYS